MFRKDAQQLNGYATGQPDTQPDDQLCNRMVTCACTKQGVTFTYPRVTRPMDAFEEYLFASFPKDTNHLIKRSEFQMLDLPEAGDALVVQVKREKEVLIRSVLVFILL